MDSNPTPGLVGPPQAAGLPPAARLLLLTSGKRISQVVYVVARLGIADHLAAGPAGIAELAEATGTHAEALSRVLRAATTFELLAQEADGTYVLTPLSALLRSDTPDSVRDLVLLNGDEILWKPYGEILHTVQTGEPAFGKVFGEEFFTYLKSHPEEEALFGRAMVAMSRVAARSLAATVNAGRFEIVCDVGGGRGHFLGEVLRLAGDARGILFDLPAVVAEADGVLAGLGVTDRVKTIGGDFFGEIPAGADAYVLKAVLHNWDDERAAKILRGIGAAMEGNPDARLLIVENIVGPPNRWDHAALLDLDMMLRFGGRERDSAQWSALLDAAGLATVHTPRPGTLAVIECVRR
ncbi:MAG: O-methyltransferase [Actinobacteria bacterium 13_2_20CM_2_72_6]|nr:MAG: O-methyltransferase [Actinobacteria bacterium 13_2_20CM_2_72_6]OLE29256.1 MAG: O-methyltransferase [Actinobacteria bacterium 13_1_20CM_3_71_11]